MNEFHVARIEFLEKGHQVAAQDVVGDVEPTDPRDANHGALHQPAANWTAQVVVDVRLVTGQNPQSARGVGEQVRDLVLARRIAPASGKR